MSAFADDPGHFVAWLRSQPEFADRPEAEYRESFVSRRIYGDYLEDLTRRHLLDAAAAAPARCDVVTDEAVDIEPRGTRCAVQLADGSAVEADRVVLATGNEPPAPLPGADDLTDHPGWIADPWEPWEHRLPGDHGVVVILGTGLSAVDTIVALRAQRFAGRIHAVSRHGWFPHAHFRGVDYPDFPPPDVDLTALDLDELVALIEQHCAVLQRRNAHPAIIVDRLRPHTQPIWAGLSRDDRLAFARDHAARWNVHRHRIAPEIHSAVVNAQFSGQLQVHASAVESLAPAGDRITVALESGDRFTGDLVINATGPANRLTRTRSPLLQNLLRRGLITPDDTDMGVRVDGRHVALIAAGGLSPYLVALGPLLRGTLWETIAVPEIRSQARRVADTVLELVGRDEEQQRVLEYMV